MHSWYQGVLANDEIRYGWMDEGFTEWAESKIMMYVLGGKNSIINNYNGYYSIAKSGFEEPMSTHGDYFHTNYAYGIAAYSKGAVTLQQLGYVIGDEELLKAMRLYFDTWKFKHPDVKDFTRVMERSSGLELDWYFHHWINTTNRIDYAIDRAEPDGTQTKVSLKRIGSMPMPIDLVVTKKDGSKEMYYIPLRVMRGEKNPEDNLPRTIAPDWPWTHPSYSLSIDIPFNEIESIVIDPSNRMADVNKQNNSVKPKS